MKDFRDQLRGFNDKKKESALNQEIDRRREENIALKKKVEELTNLLHQSSTSKIHINDVKIVRNIRDFYEYSDIQDLADNIQAYGQIQPGIVTSDSNLIVGHRRYFAIKNLFDSGKHDGFMDVVTWDKTFEDLGIELFDQIQLSENEKRTNLDNFQLSSLFKSYQDNGYSQIQISEIFEKPKTVVSEIISINKIQQEIVLKLKEIQYFGMSKNKFDASNLSESKDRNPSTIGIKTLVKIAKLDAEAQKEMFLNIFGAKLTSEELEKFGAKKNDSDLLSKTFKFKSKLESGFQGLKKKYKDDRSQKILSEAEELLQKFNKKLEELD